ncbi:hypothetical protein ACIBVL_37405 [Streptomyces sp. NPDC049687]|uniref:hypothetical protein n=1 Tax=Streptomyces sp. NPDC049687 TaxID=3365596 RepID=UPI00379D8CA1
MRHITRTATTLCAALGLTAALGTASAAPGAPPSTARQAKAPVLVDCFWHTRVRPQAFLLACGDGNSRLVSLHWKSWGSQSARATGVNVVNDCDPYCAAGHFHPYAVVVKLDHPKAWKKNPKVQHYSRMVLTYTGARPEHFPRVLPLPLWD